MTSTLPALGIRGTRLPACAHGRQGNRVYVFAPTSARRGDIPRDIGNGEVDGVDITNKMLLHGWVKVKDLKREATDDDLRRKDLESEAKSASRGQWNPHGPKVSTSTNHLVSRAPPLLLRRDGSYTTCH